MERQDEKKRLKRRRRKRFAGLLVFLLAVFSAVVVLCLAMFFKIQTITVLGTERYYAQDVVAAAELYIDQNIFAIDTGAAAEKVEKTVSLCGIGRDRPGAAHYGGDPHYRI